MCLQQHIHGRRDQQSGTAQLANATVRRSGRDRSLAVAIPSQYVRQLATHFGHWANLLFVLPDPASARRHAEKTAPIFVDFVDQSTPFWSFQGRY
jgi:hypothetical protein